MDTSLDYGSYTSRRSVRPPATPLLSAKNQAHPRPSAAGQGESAGSGGSEATFAVAIHDFETSVL